MNKIISNANQHILSFIIPLHTSWNNIIFWYYSAIFPRFLWMVSQVRKWNHSQKNESFIINIKAHTDESGSRDRTQWRTPALVFGVQNTPERSFSTLKRIKTYLRNKIWKFVQLNSKIVSIWQPILLKQVIISYFHFSSRCYFFIISIESVFSFILFFLFKFYVNLNFL